MKGKRARVADRVLCNKVIREMKEAKGREVNGGRFMMVGLIILWMTEKLRAVDPFTQTLF